jgi:hypothetical protein
MEGSLSDVVVVRLWCVTAASLSTADARSVKEHPERRSGFSGESSD